jgi:hypothetical protein
VKNLLAGLSGGKEILRWAQNDRKRTIHDRAKYSFVADSCRESLFCCSRDSYRIAWCCSDGRLCDLPWTGRTKPGGDSFFRYHADQRLCGCVASVPDRGTPGHSHEPYCQGPRRGRDRSGGGVLCQRPAAMSAALFSSARNGGLMKCDDQKR